MSKVMTPHQLDKAKRDYMSYKSVSQISRELGIARTTIQNHVNGSWKVERNFQKNELLAELSENKAAQITKIYGSSLEILTKTLEELRDRDEPLSLGEARNLTVILDSIDKIVRLDQGTPTDIIADTTPTVIEMRDLLRKDPFAEIEDADFKDTDSQDS